MTVSPLVKRYGPLMLLGSAWGCSYLAIKIVVGILPPLFAASVRMVVSLVILIIIGLLFRQPLTVPKAYRWRVWLIGFFFCGLPFAFLFWGEMTTSPGLAGIMSGTTPLWTFLLGLFFLRHDERVTPLKITGTLLGFIGIFLIFWPKLNVPGSQGEIVGTLAVGMMALSGGFGTILNRLLLSRQSHIPSYGIMVEQHVVSILLLGTLTLLFEGRFPLTTLFHSWPAMGALFYLSFFSTSLSWILVFALLKRRGALKTISANYLIPLVALVSDFLYYGRVPSIMDIAGAIAILAGIILIHTLQKGDVPRFVTT